MNQKIQPGFNVKKKNSFGFYLLQFIRVFVGVLFIFSGLIKANDPSGLAYKMQEFFEAWNMAGFSSYALILSIIMIAFEIIAGVALLLGYFFRLFSILLVLLMVFFTFLTAYAVFSGKIKECGCFGDCIPLESIQSFYKDLILLTLGIVLVIGRKHIKPLFKRHINTSLMIISLFLSIFIQWYVLQHLPFVDCLAFKVGNNITDKMQKPKGSHPDEFATTYVLEQVGTKKIKEISDNEYIDSGIWEDTTWVIKGEPQTKLIRKGNDTPPIQDFRVMDYEGNDYTEALLKEPGYNFLLFVRDPAKATQKSNKELAALIDKCNKNNVGFFLISSGNEEQTLAFMKRNNIDVDYFLLDGTVSKTAMRSNPGLILIKAGTIKGKWSYSDYPTSFKWNTPESLKVIN